MRRALAALLAVLTVSPAWAQAPLREDQRGREQRFTDSRGRLKRYIADDGMTYTFTYPPDGSRQAWYNGQLVIWERTDKRIVYYAYDKAGVLRQAKIEAPGEKTQLVTFAIPMADPQPYGFAGLRRDEATGLYDARARWYDPTTARFTGPDPAKGQVYDPPTLHQYTYAGQDPVNKHDPSGRTMSTLELSAVSGILSGLAGAGITAYRGGSASEIATAGIVTGLAAGTAVYGGEVLLPLAPLIPVLVAIGRTSGPNVAIQFTRMVARIGSPQALPPEKLPLPAGVQGLPAFGELVKWGSGPQAPLQQIQVLTPQALRAIGMTAEIATRWRDFYIQIALKNAANPSAPARALLMQHMANLLD